MPDLALIGLGSNLGNRLAQLDCAVAALTETPGLTVRVVSRYHETDPVGGPSGQGPFLNAAVAIESALDPTALHRRLREIEALAGRVRSVRWGERTLDLDLILFGSSVIDSAELRVPHPRMAVRRFVLAPLAEIAPDAVDPMTGRTTLDLLAHLDRRPSSLALDGAETHLGRAVFRAIAEALGADDPDAGPESSAERWHLQASCPQLDNQRANVGLLATATRRGGFLSHRHVADADRPSHLHDLASQAQSPTFAVILPHDAAPARSPGLTDFPLLWPEASSAPAIASEILAACTASRVATRVV